MSTSEKKNETNRRNAQHSTGPKTGAGRERSAQNAMRHGFTAQKYLRADEDPDDFKAYVQGLVEELQPVGTDEHELIRQIAIGRWRQRRIFQADASMFDTGSPDEAFHTVAAAIKVLTSHEANVRKAVAAAEKRLKELQAERPAREVSAPPSDPAGAGRTGEEKPPANDRVQIDSDRPGGFDCSDRESEAKRKTKPNSIADCPLPLFATQTSEHVSALAPQGENRKTKPRSTPQSARLKPATGDAPADIAAPIGSHPATEPSLTADVLVRREPLQPATSESIAAKKAVPSATSEPPLSSVSVTSSTPAASFSSTDAASLPLESVSSPTVRMPEAGNSVAAAASTPPTSSPAERGSVTPPLPRPEAPATSPSAGATPAVPPVPAGTHMVARGHDLVWNDPIRPRPRR